MDVNNQTLRQLINSTDEAFRQLSQAPDSVERHRAYEDAKQALDDYIASLRNQLNQKLTSGR